MYIHKVAVIGAGFSGLGMAKSLTAANIKYDQFEKNSEIGGNWYNGVYDSAQK